MNSKESLSPRSGRFSTDPANKSPVVEDTLKSERLQIERKLFQFTLKENPRGRFLRITEDVNRRRDSIIVPASGLIDFRQVLDGMIETDRATPAKGG